MKIRPEQIRAMEAPIRSVLREGVHEVLQRERPDMTEAERSERIELAESCIDDYGGDPRDDLERLVSLGLRLGSRFHQQIDWALEVLADDEFVAASKVDVLEIYAKARAEAVG